MLWIGLTGGLGTGKSTIAKIINQYGIPVIDADLIAHQALQFGQKSYFQVLQYFGPEILNEDKTVNRKKIAEIVFNNKEKLQKLESIIHPEVKNRVSLLRNKFEAENHKVAFYDVPLLFEKNMQSDFDRIVVISANLENQKQRLKLRNQWTEEEINSRLNSQLSMEEKTKGADFVIDNNGSLDDLHQSVKKMLSHFGVKTSLEVK